MEEIMSNQANNFQQESRFRPRTQMTDTTSCQIQIR